LTQEFSNTTQKQEQGVERGALETNFLTSVIESLHQISPESIRSFRSIINHLHLEDIDRFNDLCLLTVEHCQKQGMFDYVLREAYANALNAVLASPSVTSQEEQQI
jgi:hypothetical protein